MQELQKQLEVLVKEALKAQDMADNNKGMAMSGLDAVDDKELKEKLNWYNQELKRLEDKGDIAGINALILNMNKLIHELK